MNRQAYSYAQPHFTEGGSASLYATPPGVHSAPSIEQSTGNRASSSLSPQHQALGSSGIPSSTSPWGMVVGATATLPDTPPSGEPQLCASNEALWRQRVKDRDDVVRDLMRRIVQLENENESLKQIAQDSEFKKLYSKDSGTNTTFEWIVEEQQRAQLVALEEYMRFQELCLYAEWFGLCLSYHRQVFHSVRMHQQLTCVADTLHRGIITPQAGSAAYGAFSPPRETASSPSRVGDRSEATLLRVRGIVESTAGPTSAMLRASVGSHTPSSATGAALHLLRGLDALQAGAVDRSLQDIQHGCVMIQRRNRSQLREAAHVHESIVHVAMDEASARHQLELDALTIASRLFQFDLASKLQASSERQVRFLTIENKRMLEFSVAQSTSHHRVSQELMHAQHAASLDLQLVEQQSVSFAEEARRRECAHAQRCEWDAITGPLQAGSILEAQMREELRRHHQNLEGSSITLRHGEEPWSRRFVELLEHGERTTLYAARTEVRQQGHQIERAFDLRESSRGAAMLVYGAEAFGSALMDSYQFSLAAMDATLRGLDGAVHEAEERVRSQCRAQLQLWMTEVSARADMEQKMIAGWHQIVERCVGARATDAARQCTNALLETLNQRYARDLSNATSAVRKDAVEFLGAVTSRTSSLVSDAILDGNDALNRLNAFHRKASRIYLDEQRHRAEVLLFEESQYYHTALLPFVLALRECELNEEYGSLFVNVEEQTRRIMRRTIEREAAHIEHFADDGLVSAHVELGENLMEQHRDFCRSIGTFIRDDVRRSERRIGDACKAHLEREVERTLTAATLEKEALLAEAAQQTENVRRSTSDFWRDVFKTEAERLRGSFIRFASTELLAWYRGTHEDMCRLFNSVQREHCTLHAKSQASLLGFVLNGPVAVQLAQQYQCALDLVQGVFVSTRGLQRSLSDVSAANQNEVRELLDISSVRYKQQIQHAERLYLECRLQLDKEVRLRDAERVSTWVVHDEQRRRSELHATEAQELLWLIYRSGVVQRFLIRTSSSLSPSRTNPPPSSSGGWPQTARSYITTQPSAAAADHATQRAPSYPHSPHASTDQRQFLAFPSQQQHRHAEEPHVTPLVPPAAPRVASSVPRSGSESSSIFGTARSDLEIHAGSGARARRSSLVMSRSMERQRALRGDESPDARFFDAGAPSRHLGADGVALGAFSPSPLTRAELLARHDRQVQSQIRMI